MGGKNSYESIKKYQDKTYDRIGLLVPKGKREELKVLADSLGLSVSDLIKVAIEEKTGISLRREFETKADDE